LGKVYVDDVVEYEPEEADEVHDADQLVYAVTVQVLCHVLVAILPRLIAAGHLRRLRGLTLTISMPV